MSFHLELCADARPDCFQTIVLAGVSLPIIPAMRRPRRKPPTRKCPRQSGEVSWRKGMGIVWSQKECISVLVEGIWVGARCEVWVW